MTNVAPNNNSTKLATRHWKLASIAALLTLLICVTAGEWLGWPFLEKPLAEFLSKKLERPISFSAEVSEVSGKDLEANKFAIRFLGGISLHASQLNIAAPAWSKAPHLLLGNNVILKLRYIDLWRAYQARPLRIEYLQATSLDSHLERLADGRASWQFAKKSTSNEPVAIPTFGLLQVNDGFLSYNDVPIQTDIKANFSLVNGEYGSKNISSNTILKASAIGYYHKLPLKIELVSSGSLPSKTNNAQPLPVALTLNAKVGRATLSFKGNAADALHLSDYFGNFDLKGPSMAAVGDLFGVTLPTTSEFNTSGFINKQAGVWSVKLNKLDIGASHLNGDFKYATSTYDADRSVPLLSGTLGGDKLLLADLGPAVGAEASNKNKSKVLPTRPFDLASLRAMDADVRIAIKYVDLNTSYLEPLRPLRGHLQLQNGILTLKDIDAETAQGQLQGDMRLDGQGQKALWDANLRWKGVRLERWIKQVREDGLPPYISGKLNGKAELKGQGISTAEILSNLKGNFRSELLQGKISHLAIEVAGLDLAQAVGVMFQGDQVLPVECAVVDLVANEGIFRPHVMVLDTQDSSVWVDGSVSLANEALNLRAVVLPKDFSPLTLRAPININGTFAHPIVSVEKAPIGIKLASSLLLAFINPLAAIIPLFDNGDNEEAKERASSCEKLIKKKNGKTSDLPVEKIEMTKPIPKANSINSGSVMPNNK